MLLMSIHSWLKVVQLICDSWRNAQKLGLGVEGREGAGGSGGEGWGKVVGRERIVRECSNVEGLGCGCS